MTMPEGLLKIESGAFWNCDGLTAVQLPDSVTTLGGSVFRYCDNLESVTISGNLTKIEADAFNGCNKLKNINLPNSIESIGDNAPIYRPVGVVTFATKTFDEFKTLVKKVNETVHCYNEEGEDMIIKYTDFHYLKDIYEKGLRGE